MMSCPGSYTGNASWQIPRPYGIPKLESKLQNRSKAKGPRLVMQWIKEIEIAKSTDDLITPRSILKRTDVSDYDELDAIMASALRKLYDKKTQKGPTLANPVLAILI